MQMLFESSVFRTQQVTKTPCATAVAARARARAASACHVRGPLTNYMNDDDYIQGGQIGGAGEGDIGGSRPRAAHELQERRRLHTRRTNRG